MPLASESFTKQLINGTPYNAVSGVLGSSALRDNLPVYNAGVLIGGGPSRIVLMVALVVDGLSRAPGPSKKLRVPVSVIASPGNNVYVRRFALVV